ncbi:hypothetical protein BST81_07340 [Leptolyngbya sp. 'hensonii']|uniref:hypothetical protein n=1 Tax=Leptolyngbya sp. 'hensonii' TaxID=1922337 RepID=UPI0009501258|nr:hypothetical protein [Leptolyngbya sp. 'hensonii']OLP19027.1 hypothetical protein BST81_07340 [Leptolyngbya sp. 'hensonii']
MTIASTYWTFFRINPAGGYLTTELPLVKTFCQEQWLDRNPEVSPSDQQMQRHLLTIYKAPAETMERRRLAALSLRCYISGQIVQVCTHLDNQFGRTNGFTRHDLLACVLNDIPEFSGPSTDQPKTFVPTGYDILQTFDAQQSSLSTWVSLRIRRSSELNTFLLAHGIYLISDWAILNDTQLRQLERIFALFHRLPATLIRQDVQILASYHAIYRHDRLQRKSQGRCSPPTEEQLQRMVALLPDQGWSPRPVLQRLREIAELLREYRIHARKGQVRQLALDDRVSEGLTDPRFSEDDREQAEFLALFRREFDSTLERAIAQVIQQRVAALERKDAQKARNFLQALELFHCQGLAMGRIAPLIQVKQQFEVSRLLKLKDLRDAVRLTMLQHLPRFLLTTAGLNLQPDRLQQVDAALDQLIQAVIQEAEAEAAHPQSQCLQSHFARSLCCYLKEHREAL